MKVQGAPHKSGHFVIFKEIEHKIVNFKDFIEF